MYLIAYIDYLMSFYFLYFVHFVHIDTLVVLKCKRQDVGFYCTCKGKHPRSASLCLIGTQVYESHIAEVHENACTCLRTA